MISKRYVVSDVSGKPRNAFDGSEIKDLKFNRLSLPWSEGLVGYHRPVGRSKACVLRWFAHRLRSNWKAAEALHPATMAMANDINP